MPRHKKNSRRSKGRRSPVVPAQIDLLENRALLAGVVEAAQTDAEQTDNSDPAAPIEVTGGIGEQITATPTLTWEAPSQAVERYDLFINRVGNRSSAVYRQTNLTTASHTLTTPLIDGDYEVWLRTYYTDGTSSRWSSEPAQLTLNSGHVQTPFPVITGPSSSVESTRPEITWTETVDAESYEIWISSQDSTTPIVRETEIAGTSFTPTSDFDFGDYRIWVRANTSTGVTLWSAVQQLQIRHAPITATGGVSLQTTSTPTITWDDPGNVESYELYIQQSGVSGPVYRRNDLTTTSHTLETSLTSGGVYSVWVRARFNDGAVSRWGTSAELQIQTEATDIVVSSPRAYQGNATPRIEWMGLEQAVDSYDVRITNTDDSTVEILTGILSTGTPGTASAQTYQYTGVLTSANFTIEIRASFPDGEVSDWSTPTQFFIPPQAPTITGGVGIQPNGNPTITWTEIPDATYELYISGSDGAAFIYRETDLTTTSQSIQDTLADGDYNVWVRGHLQDGTTTTWSQAESLTVGTPSLETSQPGLTVVNGRATWTSIPDAAAYEIHVDQTDPFQWRVLYSNLLSGNSLNLVLPAGTYRAWVRALGPNGETGQFSDWVEFEIS